MIARLFHAVVGLFILALGSAFVLGLLELLRRFVVAGP